MTTELIIVRVKGFVYGLVSALLAGLSAWLLDFFGSDAFRMLVTEHFGETTVGVLMLLLVDGIVKHFRNMRVLGTWNENRKVASEKLIGPKPELI